MINKYEENKHRWSWLALRTARDQYLQHFTKIGSGDVLLLAHEIENAAKMEALGLREGSKSERGQSPLSGSQIGVSLSDHKTESDGGQAATPGPETKESEDVKMEG